MRHWNKEKWNRIKDREYKYTCLISIKYFRFIGI